MIEEYCTWPQIHAALCTLPPQFYCTLNDLLKTGRASGSDLKFVRHNAKRNGYPLWKRSDVIRHFARRWANAPEVHSRFSEALRKHKPEMRSH